jgi:hypothetical protein
VTLRIVVAISVWAGLAFADVVSPKLLVKVDRDLQSGSVNVLDLSGSLLGYAEGPAGEDKLAFSDAVKNKAQITCTVSGQAGRCTVAVLFEDGELRKSAFKRRSKAQATAGVKFLSHGSDSKQELQFFGTKGAVISEVVGK